MITLQVLKIYGRYEGNGDLFVRRGSEEEKEILDYDNWVLIEEFIRDFNLAGNTPNSMDLWPSFRNKLLENCEDTDTIHQLKGMAENKFFGKKIKEWTSAAF